MPIVITPTGEYIDSVTGNPVNLPPQRPDFGSGSTSNREMSAMAGMMGQGGAISDEERRFLEETNRRMAPEMRPSGSGSTSDMEMRAYEDALRPTVGQGSVSDMEMDDVAKVQMLVDMGLSPTDAMEAVAREKQMNPNPINPEAFSGGAVAPSNVENPAGMIAQGDPAMGAPSPMPRGATDMGMPENGVVADLMRRGYSPDMIASMTSGNMPPREDDAMNLERTGPPTITPMR